MPWDLEPTPMRRDVVNAMMVCNNVNLRCSINSSHDRNLVLSMDLGIKSKTSGIRMQFCRSSCTL